MNGVSASTATATTAIAEPGDSGRTAAAPYIGRFARYENLTVATGHAMMGLSLGPITGKLMAQLLSGEQPSIALESLSPDRYS